MAALGGFLSTSNITQAQTASSSAAAEVQSTEIVHVEVFTRPDCQHCRDLDAFLEVLDSQREANEFETPYTVNQYNILKAEHKPKWNDFTQRHGLSKSTPVILVGDSIIQGFDTAKTTGVQLKNLIQQYEGQDTATIPEYLDSERSDAQLTLSGAVCEDEICTVDGSAQPAAGYSITIPLIGAVAVGGFSLPALSAVLGFVDGFNPCAMWVLVTFLLVLVQLNDRKRMWQIAGLFIVAEALMYAMIMTVWFTAFDFIALDNIVTPIVGMIAVGGGLFFLYEWWSTQDEIACKVTNLEQRQKTRNKIQELASQPFTWLTVTGVIGLAFSVNIIEFACSIGIPQAFTKILELNGFTLLTSLPYIAIYILFYMLDDFIVFGIALYSVEKIGLTTKYSKWANLIGGVLMILLGFILILEPGLLQIMG